MRRLLGRPSQIRPQVRRRFVPALRDSALEDRVVLSTVEPFKVPLQWVPSPSGEPNYKLGISTVEPFKVPLQWVPSPSGEPNYKLGIYVGIGEGEPRLYEFDTGGEGFWAAFNPNLPEDRQWWGDYEVESRKNLNITYSSGNSYLANQVSTSVQLYAPSGEGFTQVVTTTQDVDLAQIVKYSDPKPGAVQKWNQALRTGQPPLAGVFYGDFGASLAPIGSSPTSAIYSILPQISLPEGLKPGFLVHVGEPDSGDAPYLQIGLTQSDVDSAETTLKMNAYTGPLDATFPVTGDPAYSQQVTTADFSWSDASGRRQSYKDVGWTIDTGALLVNVWQGNRVKVDRRFLHNPGKSGGFRVGRFKSGETFDVHAAAINIGGEDFELKIDRTGTTPAKNRVAAAYHTTAKMGRNYVNTGLLTFKEYDVMYDLKPGLIHFRKLST